MGRKEKSRSEKLRSEPEPKMISIPVIGIGMSAGGLETVETFFRNVPPHPGAAFVIVAHLDPNHETMLADLIQRSSRMPVTDIHDGQVVEADHVYVIPPDKDLSIHQGVLHLEPPRKQVLHLPIDSFFRSLALDRKEQTIGVILSGMGSDGTHGISAIKEHGGATFAQDPTSARFDGMPRSAIDSGCVDVVAPVESLPERILSYSKHFHRKHDESRLEMTVEPILALLRVHTGNDFTNYKRTTIVRRIERRMGLHQIVDPVQYVRFLRENPKEIELLFKELLINVTSFFRDPQLWDHLQRTILPEFLANKANGTHLRAWVPGCSTGEEALSLAIVFKETLERLEPSKNLSLQIFATDLDREAIERARTGIFPFNIAGDVSPERLRRFFVQEERGYRVAKSIREMVIFAPQNVIMDPPFTKLDIISCRNLLIYLSAGIQKKLISLFHYSLNRGGILCLGSAETVGPNNDLFRVLDSRVRLYARAEGMKAPGVGFPITPYTQGADARAEAPTPTPPSLQTLVDRILVQRYSPIGILTNETGDVLYTTGRTGKYLEPVMGKANWNVLAMAREGLRRELPGAFATAARQHRPVTLSSVRVRTNGSTQTVDLTVEKLREPEPLRDCMLIVISENAVIPAKPASKRDGAHKATTRSQELEQELIESQQETQSLREEMQTSQEELKSTNEELQSTNEELQSMNEELMTSKEEMQSLNEELQTLNHELQAKVDELSRTNNDMKNLLNSTDIATLFLDSQLCVRRFTTQAAKLIKLIPTDVGRPITDIATDLEYTDLVEDTLDVLRTLVFKEKLVSSRGGRWYTTRILPYRTLENVIDGVVITFTDATAAKALEATLRGQATDLRQMVVSLPMLVWACDEKGACDFLNDQWLSYTGISEIAQHGDRWLEQVHPDDRERVRTDWSASIAERKPYISELRIRHHSGVHHWFKAHAAPVHDPAGGVLRWYAAAIDVEDLKSRAERIESARLVGILGGIEEALYELDESLIVIHANQAAIDLAGRPERELVGRSVVVAIPNVPGLNEKLALAIIERRSSTFEWQTGTETRTVRLHPHVDGVSVFIRKGGCN